MWRLRTGLALTVLLVIPALLTASEGNGVPEALKRTISLDGLSGFNRVIAEIYNSQHWGQRWLYALSCTATMAVVGIVIAFVTNLLLKALGLEVHKISHRE